jgi:enoyl-CoA hydratase
MERYLRTDKTNHGILTLTLNRPDKLNALSADALDELDAQFTEAARDDTVKALLITGNGKAFCAGADIKQLAAADATTGYEFAKRGQAVFRQLETMGKPSLIAVNGFAFGGGCELAMAASIRIASRDAQFGQPEVKLGVIPGYGGTQRLARLVGKGRALDLCLSGRFIDATTALTWGLVSEVTTPEQLVPRAQEILDNILTMGPIAIKQTIAAIDEGFDLPLEQALELEARNFAECCGTEDKNEGTAAFLEKRAPNFEGK